MTQLRDRALSARGAGDPNAAAEVWRAMLDRAPDDWRLALELKRDMKAGLHYPDSDARFRRAARGLPDAEWLAHYSALYAFHGSDLEAIDARARELLGARPGEALLHAIRGDVARQRRDWGVAAASFAEAARLRPGEGEYGRRAAQARLYERLGREGWAQGRQEGGAGYSIYVVNLDRNAERMVELDRQFAGVRHRGCGSRRWRGRGCPGRRCGG